MSLRGIGPSGQSRTLVLLDGVPFNDPFGGWVYWTRVPLVSVDRIEVIEDTASSLYGNYAMGGVINIVTSRPTSRTLEVRPQFGRSRGNGGSSRADAQVRLLRQPRLQEARRRGGRQRVQHRRLPDGHQPKRGPIDNNAKVNYRNITGKARVHCRPSALTFTGRVGYFKEERDNGKIGELNDTRWTSMQRRHARACCRIRATCRRASSATTQDSHYNFLAVTNAATTRTAVRLATDQKVPVNGVGGMVQWQKFIGTKQALTRRHRLPLGRG